MGEGFGKIRFDLACRFGELTANEMRVLVYLYACLNEKTLQCNPKRKTISADAKIEKGNLSKALAGLTEKGWIKEDENRGFELYEASQIPEKVVELTTSKVKKVVEVTTEVVEVTTKSCRTNNSHIKELNREGTEKEQRSAAPAKTRKKPAVSLPSNFEVTSEMESWFTAKGFDFDIGEETENFKTKAVAKDYKYSDWSAGWRSWMLTEKKYRGQNKTANTKIKPKDAKNMLSPDFEQQAPRNTFADVMEMFYESGLTEPTAENYELTKDAFLTGENNRGFEFEVTEYEQSVRFRKIFGQAGPANDGIPVVAGGRTGFAPAASQVPVSPRH